MLNDELFQAINGFARHTPWLHGPAAAYATVCGPLLLVALLAAGALHARGRQPAVLAAALWAPAGSALAVALQRPIAEVAEQPMPAKSLPHAMTLVHGTADLASPSAHATLAGAVAAGLFLVERRLGLAAAVAGLLMGLARVYVGLHYPSDALAGLIVGAVVTMLGFMAAKPPLIALVGRLRRVRALAAR
jgi:membrane-associated phospholipid phosphatase